MASHKGLVRKPPLRSHESACTESLHAGNAVYALECAVACRKYITCAFQQVSVDGTYSAQLSVWTAMGNGSQLLLLLQLQQLAEGACRLQQTRQGTCAEGAAAARVVGSVAATPTGPAKGRKTALSSTAQDLHRSSDTLPWLLAAQKHSCPVDLWKRSTRVASASYTAHGYSHTWYATAPVVQLASLPAGGT